MTTRLATGILTLLIALVLTITSCDLRHEPSAPDYAALGWRALGEQNYREAIEHFEEGASEFPAHTDFWNGLGWAYGRLGRADTSLMNFNTGIMLADTTIVGTEVLAGRSFTNLALVQYNQAILDGKEALRRKPDWVFRRDWSMNYQHLTLNVATAFCSLGEFDSCLVWVRKLDVHFYADVNTLTGRALLVAKLEDLENEL